ncbi:MAG: hypothetical protein RLP44_04835 [Aggregatilineales bacterium]
MINPTKRRIRRGNAGLGWWLLLAIHALIFAFVVMFFPEIQQLNPELLTDNRLLFIVPAWGFFLLLHLAYVLVVDARLTVKRKRDARIIKRIYALPDPRQNVPQLPAGTYVVPLDDELDYADAEEYDEEYGDVSYPSPKSY